MAEEEKKRAEWYVVHTYSGYESKVAENLRKTVENRHLEDMIQDIRVPTETVTEIKDNRTRQVERKIYPGYVIIKMVMTDETWYIIRNIRGCTGFVCSDADNKATPLTPDEVARLGITDGREAAEIIEVDYNVGDTVRIIEGAFEDYEGVVEHVDLQKNCVRVLVQALFGGRGTSVELALDQVEPLE